MTIDVFTLKDFYANLPLGSLQASNDLLNDSDAIQTRLEKEGYIYLAGVVPDEALDHVHRDIAGIIDDLGLITPGTNKLDAITNCPPVNEEEDGYFRIHDHVQKLESFHSLPHNDVVKSIMKLLLGASAFPHPLGVARLVFPHNVACTTPPHQDYPNNQGTPELYAAWMPLTDCPRELGGLAILPESHKMGLLDLKYSLGAGNRQAVVPTQLQHKQWLTADFKRGDILIFHSYNLHCALPNITDRMRLSVDYRFQRQGEPMTPRCLEPHFDRLSWEDIYRDWKSERFQYYWSKLDLNIEPWSDDYHRLPQEHMKDAVKLSRAYQLQRNLQGQAHE